MTETLYTIDEVAALLRVHPRTVKRWMEAGQVTYVKLPGRQYRIPAAEVARLMSATDEQEPQSTA